MSDTLDISLTEKGATVKKLVFFGGFVAGYVLGARAGRSRYEQIARTSSKIWNSGTVQAAADRVRDVAPSPTDVLTGAVRLVSKKVRKAASDNTDSHNRSSYGR